MSPTPPQDDQAPATKKDLTLVQRDVSGLKMDIYEVKGDVRRMGQKLEETILAIRADSERDFRDFSHLIMSTMLDIERRMVTEEKLTEAIETSERHMKVLIEDLKHNFIGIHKDKISQHEDRIVRLEEHAGIAA